MESPVRSTPGSRVKCEIVNCYVEYTTSIFTTDDASVHVPELYDVNREFNTVTGQWTPSKGKYMVSGAGAFGLVADPNWAMVYLYNVTQARDENDGGQGRNEGNGEYNSVRRI